VEERMLAGEPSASALGRLSGIDPAVGKAIRHCLESDAADRPVSTLALAAELPGGDALTAALAAGRMPSPEMIAAGGQKGALRPVTAWLTVGAIVAGTLAVGLRVNEVSQVDPARIPKPPEVLAERARAILTHIGHTDAARDTEYWFEPDIRFVYRQSPEYLVSQNSMHVVIESDLPYDVAGMATVVLDPWGRLVRLRAIRETRETTGSPPPIRWNALF